MKKKLSFLVVLVLVCSICLSAFGCGNKTENENPVEEYQPGVLYRVNVENGEGSGVYRKGADCTIKTTLPDGDVFDGWFDGETKISDELNYTFKVEKDMNVTPKFSADENLCKVTVDGGYFDDGKDGTKIAEKGSSVTVKADENQAREFSHWTVDGTEEKITDNPYTFKAEKDTTVTAIYDSLSLIIVNGGEISGENDIFKNGTECTVTAPEIKDGLDFGFWYVEGDDGEMVRMSEDREYTFTVSNSIILNAFYCFYANISITNGTITGTEDTTARVRYGEECSITVKNLTNNQRFTGWYVGTDLLSVETTYKFVVTEENYDIIGDIKDAIPLEGLPNTVETFNWFNPEGNTAAAAEFMRYDGINVYNKADHVVIYIYTSPDSKPEDYVGKFYIYSKENGHDDVFRSVDGTIEFAYSGGIFTYLVWRDIVGGLYPLMRNAVGDSYDPDAGYYFANQLIGRKVGDEFYGDSPISPIGKCCFTENGKKVRV